MDLREDQLVEAIAEVLAGPGPEVLVGVGDDAAVVAAAGGPLVLTTDMLVEGVHFDRALISALDLGAKAVTAAVSDVAAMAASPRYALACLALPPAAEASWVVELYRGMRSACDRYGLWLVGGDLSRAERVVLAVSAVGEAPPGGGLLRSGARPGDRIVVTGALGGAAGGLLLAGRAGGAEASAAGRALLQAHRRPSARVGEARVLAGAGATAMMDVSDGLALDLWRLCRASGVGARVALEAVPVAAPLRELAPVLAVDPLELALSGGEDYELLATLPAEAVEPARSELGERFAVPLAEVGVVVEGEGLVAVDAEGGEGPLEPRGWDHFGGN